MSLIHYMLSKKLGQPKTLDWTKDQLVAEAALIKEKKSTLPSAVRREVMAHLQMLEIEEHAAKEQAAKEIETPKESVAEVVTNA